MTSCPIGRWSVVSWHSPSPLIFQCLPRRLITRSISYNWLPADVTGFFNWLFSNQCWVKRPIVDVIPCHPEKGSLATHNKLNTQLQLVFIINPGWHLLSSEASSKFQTRLSLKSRMHCPVLLFDVTQPLSRHVFSFKQAPVLFSTERLLIARCHHCETKGSSCHMKDKNPSCLNNIQTCGHTRTHTHFSCSVGVWWLCWVCS